MTSLFVKLEDFEEISEARSIPRDGDEWQMIEDGDWVSDGKYDLTTSVVKHIESGKYYQYSLSRTGSYYSDYYYSHHDDGGVELDEVVPVEKTVVITEWKFV